MEEPGNPNQTESMAAKRKSTRLYLLLLLALALGVTAFLGPFRKSAAEPTGIHGNVEEAIGELPEIVAKTPAARQLPLLLRYVNDANPALRYAAVDQLSERREPEALDAVEHAFTDSFSVARQRAIERLSDMNQERGLRLLLSAMRDEDTWIRQAAATRITLASSRDPRGVMRFAMAELVRDLDDPDWAVASLCTSALKHLTGKPWFARSIAPAPERIALVTKWKQWWNADKAHHPIPAQFQEVHAIRPARSDPAPDFDIQDVNGQAASLHGQRGRVTLINFWGTWCPNCRVELPDLARMDREYHGQRFDVIGVAMAEKGGPDTLKKWCADHRLEYRQALSTSRILDDYGHIEEVPVSVMIDGGGNIRYRWEGERDFATYSAAAERLLSELPK